MAARPRGLVEAVPALPGEVIAPKRVIGAATRHEDPHLLALTSLSDTEDAVVASSDRPWKTLETSFRRMVSWSADCVVMPTPTRRMRLPRMAMGPFSPWDEPLSNRATMPMPPWNVGPSK